MARHTVTDADTAIRVEHRRATPVGGSVETSAALTGDATGRRLTFTVHAVDDDGQRVATGEIDRVIVDRERFLAGTFG